MVSSDKYRLLQVPSDFFFLLPGLFLLYPILFDRPHFSSVLLFGLENFSHFYIAFMLSNGTRSAVGCGLNG
jgi:hypothetical protein